MYCIDSTYMCINVYACVKISIHAYVYQWNANYEVQRGTLWFPQRRTWVLSTGVPGGAPGGTSGTPYGTGPRRQITAPNLFWMKLRPLRENVCTWVSHLGHWTWLERTKRLKTADIVPYVLVPTLKKRIEWTFFKLFWSNILVIWVIGHDLNVQNN